MALKQNLGSSQAPDGSQYVVITDGSGNLLPNPGNSGLSGLATNQVTVAATATLIAPARATRNAITVTNLSTVDIYLGVSGVTAATGTLLLGAKGSSVTFPTVQAVYGISSTGSNLVSYLETY